MVIPKMENTNTNLLIILYSCLAPSFVKRLNTTRIYMPRLLRMKKEQSDINPDINGGM